MRKLGIAIAVIVVLLIAAALIVPRLIDVNQYHSQIQSQLEKRLGRQVTLGKMGLRLFPPAFDVENPHHCGGSSFCYEPSVRYGRQAGRKRQVLAAAAQAT